MSDSQLPISHQPSSSKLTPNDSAVKAYDNSLKISDIIALCLKKWYWIVISVAVCVGIAVLYILCATPQYTATCSVLLRDDAQSPTGGSSINLEDLGIMSTNTVIQDEMQALGSPDLMETVVRKLGIDIWYWAPGVFHDQLLYGSEVPVKVSFPDFTDTDAVKLHVNVDKKGKLSVEDVTVNGEDVRLSPKASFRFGSAIATGSGRIVVEKTPFFIPGKEIDLIVEKYPMRAIVTKYCKQMKLANTVRESNVVDITFIGENPIRATDILIALIDAYNQNWVDSKAQVVAATSDFIDERLKSVESELGTVDGNISAYKSENLIPDLALTAGNDIQQSAKASEQVIELSTQLQMIRYLRNFINTEGKTQVLPANTGLANTAIEQQITQYNNIMIQRNATASNSSESNPLVQELDSRLASLRRSIIASIDNQDVSLSNAIRNLERSEQASMNRVAANPRQARVLLSAERQQKVQESLYVYLLQKREENELSQTISQINTRVIRKPYASDIPTSPKRASTMLIALLIGLAIPVGVIYGKEISNTRVRGRRDVDDLNIPIVGEIPKFKATRHVDVSYFADNGKHRTRKQMLSDIVVEEGNRNIINEAFRVLRTNVNFVTADNLPSVIMLTSFNPGSGKTTICINLAITLAIKKRKVLLIDCDMRRASLSRFVNSPRKGVADYLAGTCQDVDSVIVHDAVTSGLDILPVGALPPNPTELLETQRFKSMIESLRKEYDFIFIDCPPVEMMADAQIVSSCCDRTFFVIRVGLLERAMLSVLEDYYRNRKYPNMNLILNDTDTSSRYGYRYGYGAKSYGGYGYGKKSGYGN